MAPLSPDQRRDLERAVIRARETAEEGARASLAVLGVETPAAPSALAPAGRDLRTALRARGRSLGGGELDRGIDGLVEEIAYEQWHRMLFARFLAENGLLIHPSTAAVSMAEVADLAAEEGERDQWVLAARYAAAMLPGIFRADDPAHQVRFAPEHRTRLEGILAALPAELFKADDALGWVYQFWQAKRKKEVNDSGRKIGGADLAPVTQLFTEHYMVRFLLENSLGAWWAARHPGSPLLREWKYLRFRDDGIPGAGRFEGWPERAAAITVMDPCMGSGHFLVAAADMLRKMRMEEEGLAAADAAVVVLRDNLFGLELDARCVQLAAFNLALDAWKAGGYQALPVPNIACSGIAVKGQLDDWRRLARGDANMATALERLYALFQDAPELGSLIDPTAATGEGLWRVDPADLLAKLELALAKETNDPAAAVFGAAAEGTAKAARLLSQRYWLVTTNPPFLGQLKMSRVLQRQARTQWLAAAQDLATTMLARWRSGIAHSGAWAWVLPQNWLFLPRSAEFRHDVFANVELETLVQLGEGAFVSSAAAGAFTCLAVATEHAPVRRSFPYHSSVDARGPREKDAALRHGEPMCVDQADALRTTGFRLPLSGSADGEPLSHFAVTPQGIKTGDDDRFQRAFWEILLGGRWRFIQSTVLETTEYGGRQHVIDWKDSGRGMVRPRIDSPALGRNGIAVSLMRELPVTIYTGQAFDSNLAPIVPGDQGLLPALWAFASSQHFRGAARGLEQGVKINTGTLGDIPFDLEYWQKVAAERYPDGLPEPHSGDPTQWLFKGVIPASTAPLQVAVARLLGYHWPDQVPDALDELADGDGVVPLPPVLGETPAAERLRALLARAYGPDWSPALLDRLLAEAGSPGATLESWLRDAFFAQHARLFANRPFIWQVWDGHKDGFSALLNYHRLDAHTLEKLTYTYLNDWIERQRARREESAAEARLIAALGLQDKLKQILMGEPPLDIYVRWKPLERQPIGWDPDLDDGVRLNIRPFVKAGVLRAKFTINWNKDRGANPDGSERLNDRNFTRAQKVAAREGAS